MRPQRGTALVSLLIFLALCGVIDMALRQYWIREETDLDRDVINANIDHLHKALYAYYSKQSGLEQSDPLRSSCDSFSVDMETLNLNTLVDEQLLKRVPLVEYSVEFIQADVSVGRTRIVGGRVTVTFPTIPSATSYANGNRVSAQDAEHIIVDNIFSHKGSSNFVGQMYRGNTGCWEDGESL